MMVLDALEKVNFFFFWWLCDSKQGSDKSIRGFCHVLEMESSLRIKFQGLTAFLRTLCNYPNAHHVHHSTHCRASCFRQFHQQSTINKYVKCLPCARSCVEETLSKLGQPKASTCILVGEPVTGLTPCCLGSACRHCDSFFPCSRDTLR